MRIGACVALLLLSLAALSPASAGIPVLGNCEIWADPDTVDVTDTVTVYVIVRDLYAQEIPGLTCDFFSDRGPTDIILGSPDITDVDGRASARITTAYEPFFSQSQVTVEVEGITIGPVTVSWKCRAGVDGGDVRPPVTALHQNSPNPFSDLTRIEYSLAAGAEVRLEVFDVAGRLVKVFNEGPVSPGRHAVTWDGASDEGAAMPPGIYYVRMSEPAGSLTRPLALIR